MTGVALSHYAGASQRRLDLIGRSLRNLSAGRLHEAYILADMSCTCRVPAVEDLLLRGEIVARLGFAALAHQDIEAAFAIDPCLPAVQVRMLELLRLRGETAAADLLSRAILRLDPQPAVLRAAVAALKPAAGTGAIARVRPGPASLVIDIFSAAPRSFEIEVGFDHHSEHLLVQSGPDHALVPILGAAGSFEIAWPDGARAARFASEPALDWTGPPAFRPFYSALPRHHRGRGWRKAPAGPVTLIMPVYGDIELTRACIDSVLASRSVLSQRLVLVDDCGPDPALRALLAAYARQPDIALIVNPINLGFIGSVNRALLDYPDGDVVLLNADTIVAPGWLERLSQAAYSRVGIGTATPLSNHGELTSVPAPLEGTSMPAPSVVAAIDAAVSALNPGATIDLPNGVGFCLYITESCRHATGLLNDVDYREGYLEEVDYCQRASELGFSHVCACDVFVGHVGSRSFRSRKRGLVTHNLAKLQRAFPAVKAMTHRFLQVDPLLSLRDALQKRLLEAGVAPGEPVTLVIGAQALPAIGAPDLPVVTALSRERPLLRLSFAGRGGGGGAMLHRDGAMSPYRLKLDLGADNPVAALLDCMRGHRVEQIVYLDAHHPRWARAVPRLLGVAYDVHAVDDSVLDTSGTVLTSAEQSDLDNWSGFLEQARSFVSASSIMADLAQRSGLRRPEYQPLRFASAIAAEQRDGLGGPDGIALFLNESDAEAWRWVQGLGRAITRQRCRLRLVVFGATRDDDGLRRTGAVTVTRMPSEVFAPAMFALHRCIATLALIPEGVLDHADLDVIAQSPRPLLSWNRYLPDVLGCSQSEALSFAADQPVEAVLQALTDRVGGRHG